MHLERDAVSGIHAVTYGYAESYSHRHKLGNTFPGLHGHSNQHGHSIWFDKWIADADGYKDGLGLRQPSAYKHGVGKWLRGPDALRNEVAGAITEPVFDVDADGNASLNAESGGDTNADPIAGRDWLAERHSVSHLNDLLDGVANRLHVAGVEWHADIYSKRHADADPYAQFNANAEPVELGLV